MAHAALPFIDLTSIAESSSAIGMPTCQVGYLETEFDTPRDCLSYARGKGDSSEEGGFRWQRTKKSGPS
jgi:hypothetical protein